MNDAAHSPFGPFTDEEICLGLDEDNPHGSIAPPLVRTSLFSKKSARELVAGLASEYTEHVYTLGQNPTVEVLEGKLAALERGQSCKCFASGMAAISAVLIGLLQQGDHILFVNQIYGPTLELAEQLERFGLEHSQTLRCDPDGIEAALEPNTRMILFESPGTMLLRLVPIDELVALARRRDILTVIDNSWATPLLLKAIPTGVDIVVHSTSKYLGGHSDVLGGAVIASRELLEKIFYNAYLLLGGVLSPSDAWLIIRGMRTLPARMRQHGESGLKVARFLEDHPAVTTVFHPALREPELAAATLKGYAGVFSFDVKDAGFDRVCDIIDRLRRFRIGVSWGGVESLVLSPNRGTNLDFLESQGIPPGLIRIAVGLEDPDTLIADLDQALSA